MSTHTPAPWVVDEGGPMHSMVCETARHFVSGISLDLPREAAYAQDEANARLIAQAPALLALSERLLAAVNNEDFSEYAETLELIKETVAKAKGEVKP